jgi:hypothetical protein
MPYIKQSERKQFEKILGYLTKDFYKIGVGELNYLITMICKFYLKSNGESYRIYNDIMGALTCAKLELYRRKASPYEDSKIKANGDVY